MIFEGFLTGFSMIFLFIILRSPTPPEFLIPPQLMDHIFFVHIPVVAVSLSMCWQEQSTPPAFPKAPELQKNHRPQVRMILALSCQNTTFAAVKVMPMIRILLQKMAFGNSARCATLLAIT